MSTPGDDHGAGYHYVYQTTDIATQSCNLYATSGCTIPGPWTYDWSGIDGQLNTPFELADLNCAAQHEIGWINMSFLDPNGADLHEQMGWYEGTNVDHNTGQAHSYCPGDNKFGDYAEVATYSDSAHYVAYFLGEQSPGANGRFQISKGSGCWNYYINTIRVFQDCVNFATEKGAALAADEIFEGSLAPVRMVTAWFGNNSGGWPFQIRNGTTNLWEAWDTSLSDGGGTGTYQEVGTCNFPKYYYNTGAQYTYFGASGDAC